MSAVRTQLDRITSLEELEGFAEMLRNPPAGVEVKEATEADWAAIAERKIQYLKRRAGQ
jgi:hypothetical protein